MYGNELKIKIFVLLSSIDNGGITINQISDLLPTPENETDLKNQRQRIYYVLILLNKLGVIKRELRRTSKFQTEYYYFL